MCSRGETVDGCDLHPDGSNRKRPKGVTGATYTIEGELKVLGGNPESTWQRAVKLGLNVELCGSTPLRLVSLEEKRTAASRSQN